MTKKKHRGGKPDQVMAKLKPQSPPTLDTEQPPLFYQGHKPSMWPQSDDQFLVWNHAVDHGLYRSMTKIKVCDSWSIVISVPKFDLYSALPFDYNLHQVAERLRAA